MKCYYNCKREKNIKYFSYKGEKYCYDCLREYFMSEMLEQYFDNFLYEECEQLS